MNIELKNKVVSRFTLVFSKQPSISVYASGRINLIGEHTDYNEGFVLPASINKGIVASFSKTTASKSTVVALDLNESYDFDINAVAPLENGGWRNYVLGVLAGIQQEYAMDSQIQAVFSGNIPQGSGLSSSAALENAIGFGINKLFGLGIDRVSLAKISQQAEHNYVGVKCGIMDQFASMLGDDTHALLLDCRSLETQKISLDLKDYEILLLNTNVTHNLGDSQYNLRREACESVVEILQKQYPNISALRDASLEQMEAVKSEFTSVQFQRASYVIEENNRVKKAIEALQNNDLITLGGLMNASHRGLSTQYEVSCAELDFLAEKAQKHSDILGSRMMGGGFGGCTINLVKASSVEQIIQEFSEAYQSEFSKSLTPISAVLANGTYTL